MLHTSSVAAMDADKMAELRQDMRKQPLADQTRLSIAICMAGVLDARVPRGNYVPIHAGLEGIKHKAKAKRSAK